MTQRTTERSGSRSAGRVARMRTPALVAGGTAALLGYISQISPYASGNYPSCPLYLMTGLYCPGCGTLRCLHSLTNGDLAAAWARNPLMMVLLVVLAVAFVRWVMLRWRGQPFVWNPPNWVPIAIGIGVIAYGVLRNIPGFEFLGP